MQNHDGHEGNQAADGMNRRDMLVRGAILGGAVWATPAITTLSRAYAQGSPPDDECPSGVTPSTFPYEVNGNSDTFTVPPGVTRIRIHAWGGGGSGSGTGTGQGGGGGGYASTLLDVTPCTSYAVVAGSGGTGVNGAGSEGGDSSVSGPGTSPVILLATGGQSAAQSPTRAGGTGTVNTGSDQVTNSGGSGGAAGGNGGAGGGSGGHGGAGGNGTTGSDVGIAGPGDPGGAAGGAGATGNNNDGGVGGAPGGGGGGRRGPGGGAANGNGGTGRVRIVDATPAP